MFDALQLLLHAKSLLPCRLVKNNSDISQSKLVRCVICQWQFDVLLSCSIGVIISAYQEQLLFWKLCVFFAICKNGWLVSHVAFLDSVLYAVFATSLEIISAVTSYIFFKMFVVSLGVEASVWFFRYCEYLILKLYWSLNDLTFVCVKQVHVGNKLPYVLCAKSGCISSTCCLYF